MMLAENSAQRVENLVRKVLVLPESSSSKVTTAEPVARNRRACGHVSPSLETCRDGALPAPHQWGIRPLGSFEAQGSIALLFDCTYHFRGFPQCLSRWRIRLQCWTYGFDPWVGKSSWRRKWQPTPIFLPGKSHGQRSLVGYSPWGSERAGHGWATEHSHHFRMSALTSLHLSRWCWRVLRLEFLMLHKFLTFEISEISKIW